MDESHTASVESNKGTLTSSIKKKKFILFFLKIIISACLLYYILQKTNFSEIFHAINSANIILLIVAFLMHLIGLIVSSIRWKILLKAQNINSNISYLMKSYLVALFFNNFLPTTIGGDTVRAYDSWRAGKNKAKAVIVIFIDRFLGLFVLILFVSTALFFENKLTVKIPFLHLWTILGSLSMLLIIWLIFIPSKKVIEIIANLHIPFSVKLQRIIEKVINACWEFKGQRNVLGKALLLSVILQVNVVTYYFLISYALDFPIPYYIFYLIVPLAIFTMMLPISINGIGLRENVFFFFFSVFGISQAGAIGFAWIELGFIVAQGSIGGVVYLLRK